MQKPLTKEKYLAMWKFSNETSSSPEEGLALMIKTLRKEGYMEKEVKGETPELDGLVTPEHVVKVVAHFFNITAEEVYDFSNKKPGVVARHVSMLIMRKRFKYMGLHDIGSSFGKRYNHSSVIYGIKQATGYYTSQDAAIYPIILNVLNKLEIKL